MEDTKKPPNPNGANNSQSDPREQVFWDLYIENNLENAYKCAIEVGYEESNAKNITMREWFKERLRKLKKKDMVSKAEKVLNKTLEYSTENDKGEVKVDLLRVQVDVAKHVTEKLGKEEGYENEKTIFVLPQELITKNELT
jgi:hypothetical protein